MAAAAPLSLTAPAEPDLALAKGIGVGLVAASIGALYVVVARWGIAHGAGATDLTALRFGVAGLVMAPVLLWHVRTAPQSLLGRWRLWLAVSLLAGTPFGLLMFGALAFAPASHAAVFPFAAMSVMGMLLGAAVLGERMTRRRGLGIAVVLAGLVLVSGVDAGSFTGRALLGDAMFLLAGTLWAGFGIVLRRHRLDPLLATAVIAVSALLTYVPVWLWTTGGAGLRLLATDVLVIEALVQGVIAGAGTLLTYAKMVSLLGPARAAVFPALAPGLAALLAFPVLGVVPGPAALLGLLAVILGLLLAVTARPR